MPKELVTLRVKNKLTVREMADKLGISSVLYSKVECGHRTPSFNFLKRFKEAFPDEKIDEYFFNN